MLIVILHLQSFNLVPGKKGEAIVEHDLENIYFVFIDPEKESFIINTMVFLLIQLFFSH